MRFAFEKAVDTNDPKRRGDNINTAVKRECVSLIAIGLLKKPVENIAEKVIERCAALCFDPVSVQTRDRDRTNKYAAVKLEKVDYNKNIDRGRNNQKYDRSNYQGFERRKLFDYKIDEA